MNLCAILSETTLKNKYLMPLNHLWTYSLSVKSSPVMNMDIWICEIHYCSWVLVSRSVPKKPIYMYLSYVDRDLNTHMQNNTAHIRCVFTGTWTICEGCKCRKDGKFQHSYFRLQKFAKHAQGVRKVLSIVRGMLETFARNFKLFWNSRRTKNDSHKQLTNPCKCLKYECWTLPFFRHSHPSQIVHVPVKTHL